MGVSTGGHLWVTTLPSRHPSPQPGLPTAQTSDTTSPTSVLWAPGWTSHLGANYFIAQLIITEPSPRTARPACS